MLILARFQVILQGKMAAHSGLVALDQISLTPDCFTKSDVWKPPHMEEGKFTAQIDKAY